MEEFVVVLVTTDGQDQADAVARAVLEPHLAACVNMVAGVRSQYWWQGQLEQTVENLLLIKTRRSLLDKVTAAVKAVHSYSVPEVLALSVAGGNPDYLKWLEQETREGHGHVERKVHHSTSGNPMP